ncbi:LacI family DNA-binding transcriptional regulator [Polycladidibacter stylochi]|uniref:LacI family DNA-binding transcriptional regulator n=1 Tax=Polycladidibacter stylochi TaxID=1807766 RepID=UPI0008354900|nr:LacI family DNA-binding transcriptional regulator [Pseudovibrio stylochi]
MRKNITKIQDVARMAGVSTATVSRTLSMPEKVSKATRKAVLDAVEKTGYRLNSTARNLRQQRSGALVALVPNLGNPFFSQLLAGIELEASKAGLNLLIVDSMQPGASEDRVFQYLLMNRCDGIIIMDGSLPLDKVKNISVGSAPPKIVCACEWLENDPFPCVRVDNMHASKLAISHLHELGHWRIGVVSGPKYNRISQARLEGAYKTIEALGLPVVEEWSFEGDYSISSGARAAASWANLSRRPTSVFCLSDEMALGFISELNHMGFKVPLDVSVVGFDDIEIARHYIPPLTTIHQPRTEIGTQAAKLLIDLIAGDKKEEDEKIKFMPVNLVVRSSTAPPRNN